MTPPASRCVACGEHVAPPPLRFACPNRGRDGADHVLEVAAPARAEVAAATDERERNPFLRYRTLSYAWRLARARGLSDETFVELVRALDTAVAGVDGAGFTVTPLVPAPQLAAALGVAQVHVKDETRNVSGSHKARHLFGLALVQAVAERAGLPLFGATEARPPWAIASCGNAALAAAVVASAARRRLLVFVPPWADPPVVARLRALGAELTECPRRADDPPGDPCHHRFRAAVAAGAVPFSCQGSDNGLTIDGGMTLGFELAEAAPPRSAGDAHLFVQVGGGALASAVARGIGWMHELAGAPASPALCPVQTAGCFPLVRAWRRMARELCAELGAPCLPAADLAVSPAAAAADAATARWLRAADPGAKARVLARTVADRARYMWPWETEPHSAASGILDDETYDYAAILAATLATGGYPVIATEDAVAEATTLARLTGVSPSATGAAGLAGALCAAAANTLRPDDTALLLFTGVRR